jgi:hypothetical protein
LESLTATALVAVFSGVPSHTHSSAAFTRLTPGLLDRAFYARGARMIISKARFNGLWVEGFSLVSEFKKHAEAR